MNFNNGMTNLPPKAAPAQTKNLCCQCGVVMEPNPLNTCIFCIQSKVDITEDLSKMCLLQFCNKCDRYLQPPTSWAAAELESRQLLGICLKRVKGLTKMHLVDAGFIWTEPHSKRIKVKLTVQKDVGGAVLQQTCMIEFTVVNQICDDCQRVEAKDYWKCVVQVRQKTLNKKTFFYLEQLILKTNAHNKTVSIKQTPDGIDFYYSLQDHARKLVEFLMTAAPCRYSTSKRMISHDVHTNTYNYKFTYSLEIAPICKDDIVCLPQKICKENGNFGPVCVCTGVTQVIHLLDPKTLKMIQIDQSSFWAHPFKAISTPKQLRQYTIMDVDLDSNKPHVFGKESHKHDLADAWVLKTSDLTKNTNNQVHTKTHLGRLLNIGDTALGFDLANTNINDDNFDEAKDLKPDSLPDVILVKKLYGDRQKRHKKRKWRLNRLNVEKEGSLATIDDKDYLDFLEDLEEDPNNRVGINIYKDPKKMSAMEAEETDNEGDLPEIPLLEMLGDLHINDEPMEAAE